MSGGVDSTNKEKGLIHSQGLVGVRSLKAGKSSSP